MVHETRVGETSFNILRFGIRGLDVQWVFAGCALYGYEWGRRIGGLAVVVYFRRGYYIPYGDLG